MMPKPFTSFGNAIMRTEQTLVTHPVFTYVAVDQMGSLVPVPREEFASFVG